METETVKPPKVLPNMMRKVMPGFVVASKYSQGKKDLGESTETPFSANAGITDANLNTRVT